MKLGILFSGGKDSTYASYLASKEGYEIKCLITVESENKDSFMFHTPAIEQTKKQAEAMQTPWFTHEYIIDNIGTKRFYQAVIKQAKHQEYTTSYPMHVN